MPVFYYKAVDTQGASKQGEMTAEQEAEVVRQLQDSGLVPIQVQTNPLVTASKTWTLRRRVVHSQDVIDFTRNLATLLNAGVELDRALQIQEQLCEKPAMATVVADVRNRVREGAEFTAALQAHTKVFQPLYVSIVRAGELVGNLGQIVSKLADYLERNKQLRDDTVSALMYPALLLVVTLLSVLGLMLFVLPQFTQMFEGMEAALPWSTQIVVSTGEWLQQYIWTVLPGGILLLAGFKMALADPRRRLQWHKWLLTLPLVGTLLAKLDVARFSYTMGLMLSNGVPLLAALRSSTSVMRNGYLQHIANTAKTSLEQGSGFAETLRASGVFPLLATHMISVGEETGQLGAMLQRVADTYDSQVRVSLQRLVALLEPILIVGLGLLVAGIIISILMAVLGMNDLVM
ncbi:MAG: type II secretion system F family protein [Gammaproteobacteria bacterium]|nr:type II secretion system F family protein [Gammaproteobacteria bacterium]MDH5799972.1 type II secretion system F family protein [Gammaproteobacteria bacterium]